MGDNPSHFTTSGAGKEAVVGRDTSTHPVEMVSWINAVEFCEKLSRQEKLKPFYSRSGETVTLLVGTGYRLPREAEWEFSCRAGTRSKYWSGDRDGDLAQAGWFGTNSGGRTHAVGELKANPFGLHDMHGNAWEWVQDSWESTYHGPFPGKPGLDPNGPFSAGSPCVFRGGNWYDPATRCRASTRHADAPTSHSSGIGLRVSLTVDAVRQMLKETGQATPNRPQAPAK